jgi:outer membrane protein assembly factor BamB
MRAPTAACSSATMRYMPLVLTSAALLECSAAWNRSTAADRETGFGVWIVTFPSIPGSTVYLTARVSPRTVFAACGAGTLTRLRVTASAAPR